MIKSKFILNNYTDGKFIKTGRKAGNASYFYRDDKQYLISRESNYIYGKFPNGSVKMYMENAGAGFNIDEALYENGIFLKLLTTCNHSASNDVGYEDARCIKWNDKQYIMFNRRNIKNPSLVQMHLGEIDENLNYVNDRTLPNLIQIEKNWQPVETMPGICIYSYKPFKIVNVFTNQFKDLPNNVEMNFRGSSQIVKYGENLLGIVHIRNEAFEYLSYLILFDKNLKILKISEPFSFFGANVEFVTHIEYNNKLKILLSLHDQIIYEFIVHNEIIEKILNKELDNNNNKNTIYTKFFNDALTNGNIFAAIGLSTFSNDRIVLEKSIELNHLKNYFKDDLQKKIQSFLISKLK